MFIQPPISLDMYNL